MENLTILAWSSAMLAVTSFMFFSCWASSGLRFPEIIQGVEWKKKIVRKLGFKRLPQFKKRRREEKNESTSRLSSELSRGRGSGSSGRFVSVGLGGGSSGSSGRSGFGSSFLLVSHEKSVSQEAIGLGVGSRTEICKREKKNER